MLKKAFLTNSSGIMCSRIFGFLRDLSMAHILGAGIYSDIFFVAFKFPNLFRRIFCEGAFSQSFLPNFIASSKKGAFVVLTLGAFSIILLCLSLFVMAFSGGVTRILALGFSQNLIEIAKPIVAIHFWYLLLVFWVTFFSALLQYKQHFWVSAYNTALLNIAMILALFLAQGKDELEIVYFVSYGVLLGGVAQVGLHFYPLWKLGFWRLFVCGVLEIKKAFFSGGNSPAGSHLANPSTPLHCGARPSAPHSQGETICQSTTSRARIVDSSISESSLRENPQDSRGNLTQNDKTNSPSLAEGVRGRVDSNAELSLQDSENDRGTSLPATQVANECEARAGAVAKQNLVKIASNSKNAQLELQGDCHALDSMESNARNDEKNFLCRPEALAEVSLARKNNRDISGLSPQDDKDIDSHAEKSDFLKKPHIDCFDKNLESRKTRQSRSFFSNDSKQQKSLFSATYFLQTSGVVNKKGIAKILSLFHHLKYLKTIRQIFITHNITAVISVGGFSAAPASFGALLFNKPLFIHEQNAIKGKLNALLSPFAKRIFSSFSKNSVPYPTKSKARVNATVRQEIKTIGFIGGSQGARTINSLALSLAPTLLNRGFSIIHQCGQNELESTKSSYKKLGLHCSQNEESSPSHKNSVEVFGFSKDIIAKLAQVDICICRAGASSVWENAALGLPMIYIPYPYAAQNHQVHNAEFFTSRGLGHIVLESKKEKTKAQIEEMKKQILTHIEAYIKSPERLESTSKSLIALASNDGAKIIIDEILAEINNSKH